MENKMNHHTFILGMVSGAVLAILIIFASSANAAQLKLLREQTITVDKKTDKNVGTLSPVVSSELTSPSLMDSKITTDTTNGNSQKVVK